MLALIIAGLKLQKSINVQSQANEVKLIVTSIGSKIEETHPTGKTALNLLAVNHNITLKNTFIECIDNVCADSGYWWKFSVNEKESSESAHFYKVKDGDTIEFRFAKK
ncbi:DUF4430 domain-containing protein [Candidatus Woesearchaeota archaeon]|nr:DUF4430 domain-containing protein [Candidatus Woesearchaeota archaeon]